MSDDRDVDPQVDDPMSALVSAATGVHELFLSYVAVGFTRLEALVLVTFMMRDWKDDFNK